MATRSRIAVEHPDGKVQSIYCHWDGYPDHNGTILQNHYTNLDKILQLINLGALSKLAPNPKCPPSHSFNQPVPGYCVAYHRDRNEDLDIQQHDSIEDFFNSNFEEYGYCWSNNQWLMKSRYGDLTNLKAYLDYLEQH